MYWKILLKSIKLNLFNPRKNVNKPTVHISVLFIQQNTMHLLEINGEFWHSLTVEKIFMVSVGSQTSRFQKIWKAWYLFLYTGVCTFNTLGTMKTWLRYHFLTWDLCESPWQEPPYVNSAFLFMQEGRKAY